MKKILKIVIFTMTILNFSACSVLHKTYFYDQEPNKYVHVIAYVTENEKRDSPIDFIDIRPINYANRKTSKKVEILSDKIKAVYNGKEYSLNVKGQTAVLPYKEGVILKEGTVLYFGKVRVDDKRIIDMPPVKLKQYIKVYKYNPIADGFNIDTTQNIYYGPVEGYKGR